MNKTSENKTITIVSVTGHQDYAQGSAYAIERSYEELLKKLPAENLKCLLISPERPEHLADYVEYIACKPFSYLEYNLFILYSLDDFIDTDFALVVQNDGFVVDGNNWRDEFFDYDFIGAPLQYMHEYIDDNTIKQYAGIDCEPFYENMPENIFEGQNGGFSLRSKKLLGILRKLNIRYHFPIPNKVSKNMKFVFQYLSGGHHEDSIITVVERKKLLDNGIRYAPPIISTYFACESSYVHRKRNIPLSEVLGCHTFGHLILESKSSLFMEKKMKFLDQNIATNSQCNWLLASNMDIKVPTKFLETESKNLEKTKNE